MKIKSIILILIIGLLFVSCEPQNGLDLEGNWIEIKQYDNSLDANGKEIVTDAINASIEDEFIIKVFSQAQPGYQMMIFGILRVYWMKHLKRVGMRKMGLKGKFMNLTYGCLM